MEGSRSQSGQSVGTNSWLYFHSPERLRRDLAHVNAFVGARLTLVPLTCSDFLAASRAGLPCLSFGSGYGCQLPGRSPAAHIVLADIPDFGAGQLILWRVCYEVRKTMWRGYGRGTRCLDSEQLCDPGMLSIRPRPYSRLRPEPWDPEKRVPGDA